MLLGPDFGACLRTELSQSNGSKLAPADVFFPPENVLKVQNVQISAPSDLEGIPKPEATPVSAFFVLGSTPSNSVDNTREISCVRF